MFPVTPVPLHVPPVVPVIKLERLMLAPSLHKALLGAVQVAVGMPPPAVMLKVYPPAKLMPEVA